jgi:hypothetical protein
MRRLDIKRWLVACLVLALLLPRLSLAAAGAAGDVHAAEDVARYTEEVAGQDALIKQQTLDEAGRRFESLYMRLWTETGMDGKLKKAVDAAVDSEMAKAGFLDKIKGSFSKEVFSDFVDNAVKRAQKDFAPHYDEFVSKLLEAYSATLGSLFADFVERLSTARSRAGGKLPGYQTLQRLHLDDAARQANRIAGDERPVEAAITWKDLKGVTGGVAILALRQALRKKVVQGLVKRLLGAAGDKVIGAATGPVGWIVALGLTVHDVYSLAVEITAIPDKLKSEIYKDMSQEYAGAKGPMWADKGAVRDQTADRMDVLYKAVAGGLDSLYREFGSCPDYVRLASNLPEKDKELFAWRLYNLKGGGKAQVTTCELVRQVGDALLQVGEEQIDCIRNGINSIGIERVGKWTALDRGRICDVMKLPPERLVGVEPTKENLARLIWALKRPPQSRPVALSLQFDEQRYGDWLLKNLDQGETDRLLTGKTVEQVKEEIDRRKVQRPTTGLPPTPPQDGSWLEWLIKLLDPEGKILGPTRELIKYALLLGLAFAAVIALLLMNKIGLFRLFGRFMRWLLRRPAGPKELLNRRDSAPPT